jgi:NADH-quinone oxidoreductase subunit L
MGIIFHSGRSAEPTQPEVEDHEDAPQHGHGEANWSMLAPIGILAVLTVIIGFAGPWVSDFLTTTFDKYFTGSLHLVVVSGNVASSSALTGLGLEIIVAVASTLMIIAGAYPAYRLYIQHKSNPETIVGKSRGLQTIYKFLWNRWYIDAFYNKVFVNTTLAIREPLNRFIESPIDRALNNGIPRLFNGLSKQFKKIQTGILSVNMLYFLVFLVIALIVLWLGGFL